MYFSNVCKKEQNFTTFILNSGWSCHVVVVVRGNFPWTPNKSRGGTTENWEHTVHHQKEISDHMQIYSDLSNKVTGRFLFKLFENSTIQDIFHSIYS